MIVRPATDKETAATVERMLAEARYELEAYLRNRPSGPERGVFLRWIDAIDGLEQGLQMWRS